MSEVFFHVDRTNSLELGDELGLDWSFRLGGEKASQAEPENKQILQEIYPEGLSRHGFRYASAMVGEDENINTPGESKPLVTALPISDSDTPFIFSEPNSARYEWLFELVRLAEFESCHSRFQSVFGWQTQSEIGDLSPVQDRDSQLVKLSCDSYDKRDMNLLKFRSFSGGFETARKYWEGDTSSDPTWEILMEPPVEVVEIKS